MTLLKRFVSLCLVLAVVSSVSFVSLANDNTRKCEGNGFTITTKLQCGNYTGVSQPYSSQRRVFDANAFSYVYVKPNSKLSIKKHTLGFSMAVSGYTWTSSLAVNGIGASVRRDSSTKSSLSISSKNKELQINTHNNKIEGNLYSDLSVLFGPLVKNLERIRWLELDGVSSVQFNNKLEANSCHLNQYW